MTAATKKCFRNLQPHQLLVLEKINRADRLHLRSLPVVIFPERWEPDELNFDNRRGLSMHAYSLPGYPASHACVRLLETDAKWLYDWGEQYSVADDRQAVLKFGTPVLIVGRYDFNSPPPWRSPALLIESADH